MSYLTSWPVINYGHHLSFIFSTEVHSTWASEQSWIVLAYQTYWRSVDYWSKIFNVINQYLKDKIHNIYYSVSQSAWSFILIVQCLLLNVLCNIMSHSCHVVCSIFHILPRLQYYLVDQLYSFPAIDTNPLTIDVQISVLQH